MRCLLDTHVLVWWLTDDSKLSSTARQIIGTGSNLIYVSAATLWEIRIKESLGKIEVPKQLVNSITESGFEWLAVNQMHADGTRSLPQVHRDPFDRMLVSQAICESLTLVSADDVLAQYPAKVVF